MFTDKFIEEQYKEIKKHWEANLKDLGVTLSTLKKRNGSYTINALVLVYLYVNIRQVVSKEELTAFLRNMGYDVIDMQQARHLSTQNGWYIISGQRGDIECSEYSVAAGEYMLLSVTEPYPQFKEKRRKEQIKPESWEDLKRHYNNRCVSCGSEEGKKNLQYKNSITKLLKGHKNPGKPLTIDNIIPQCQFCNGTNKDYFIFDNKGRIVEIYNPKFLLKSNKETQTKMLQTLIEENPETAKEILNRIK